MTFEVEVTHGGQLVRYREVTRTLPGGTQVFSSYVPLPGGGEHEMIRTTYRRREPPAVA